MIAGNKFNASRKGAYPHNEVYIEKPGDGYTWLDSYDPQKAEIVSRKYTQLSDIDEKTAVRYIKEIELKYAAGSVIGNVPSSGALAGEKLNGNYILEVPVQTNQFRKLSLTRQRRPKCSSAISTGKCINEGIGDLRRAVLSKIWL